MSTTFFEVCEKCLGGERHFHRKNDISIVRRYYGGNEIGVQIIRYGPISDNTLVMPEYGDTSDELISVGTLLKQAGRGKK